MMKRAVISFASIRGKREENVRAAIHAAERLPNTTVIVKSSLYESGAAREPDRLSLCAVVLTELSPCALLGACRGIEAAMGRIPDDDSGLKVVDIDLLIYEGVAETGQELTLPHKDLFRRAMFLVPLAEIFPDGKALGVDFGPARRKIDATGVKSL
jgi:2-amino-4-hydroxy-6-hydroxymethyldihydropteridine diphosphokinase